MAGRDRVLILSTIQSGCSKASRQQMWNVWGCCRNISVSLIDWTAESNRLSMSIILRRESNRVTALMRENGRAQYKTKMRDSFPWRAHSTTGGSTEACAENRIMPDPDVKSNLRPRRPRSLESAGARAEWLIAHVYLANA